jgi:hypothetical protein
MMREKRIHEMNALELRVHIRQLQDDQHTAETRLATLVRNCRHDWSEVKYDPIVREGYHYEASGGGVDYRPGGYVPRSEEKRWSRTCKLCGHTEYTKEQVATVMVPKFPGVH